MIEGGMRTARTELCVRICILNTLHCHPVTTHSFLSMTRRCAPFSASADGFVRSEGVGAVVVRRLSDAKANGDAILAVVRGYALNHNGYQRSIFSPCASAQQAVAEEALRRARVDAGKVGYVESHGVGTPVGDKIEMGEKYCQLNTKYFSAAHIAYQSNTDRHFVHLL
jgi:3-oxoacyl-(acyl-carrier-protein) synthase